MIYMFISKSGYSLISIGSLTALIKLALTSAIERTLPKS